MPDIQEIIETATLRAHSLIPDGESSRAEWDAARYSGALMKILKLHSPVSFQHCAGTARNCRFIAGYLGLAPVQIAFICRCGFLHDVGKLCFPDELLTQAEPFTPAQMVLIRNHSEYGCRILGHVPACREEAEIAYAHHERMDGTGYPRGLRGVELNLATRIVSVADVLDVIRWGRSYAPPHSVAICAERLREGRGTQFDREIVDLLAPHLAEMERMVPQRPTASDADLLTEWR